MASGGVSYADAAHHGEDRKHGDVDLPAEPALAKHDHHQRNGGHHTHPHHGKHDDTDHPHVPSVIQPHVKTTPTSGVSFASATRNGEAVKHGDVDLPAEPSLNEHSKVEKTYGTSNGNGGSEAKSLLGAVKAHDTADKTKEPIHGMDDSNGKADTISTKDSQVKGYEAPAPDSEDHLVTEHVQSKSGEALIGIRPSDDYEKGLALDKKEAKHSLTKTDQKDESSSLVSGRKAGTGWDRSHIRWAPMNVPIKRRLQTGMVFLHTISIAGFLGFFLLLCAIPLLWPLILPYMIFLLVSNEGHNGTLRRRSPYLRSLRLWSLFASYFPARLHRSEELPPTRKYVFGYHPHGIISHGAFAAFATEALGFSQLFPGITNTLLTLESNFRIPLYRDWALALGLASVSKQSIENLLAKGGHNGEGMGRAVTIVVGGARESLNAEPGTLRLVLNRRKGFIKIAIRSGADLVPILAFGENDLYDQVRANTHPRIHRWQLFFKKAMGFTVPLFHARGIFNYDVGIMPYRRPVNIVVGKPIRVVQSDKPEPAYIDELQTQYKNELQRIWDEWSAEFAPDSKGGLEIVD